MSRRPVHCCNSIVLAVSLAAGTLPAQRPPAVSVAGEGPETWVLVSGMVGGVAGFRRLEAGLVAAGKRVIVVDPYNLSLDSADVSFAALARRVDALLVARGVISANLVGHSHGGGVALRLAAQDPGRIASLWLLDVGALPVNRTTMFGGALRFLPFISRLPGGRRFLRDRFLDGLQKNSGQHDWLDSTTRHLYADPMLDDIGPVVALARRLGAAREPEPVAAVVAHVRAPVTVLIGDVPHESGASRSELDALRPLGARLRVEHLPGVGHFPHEEAPAAVMRRLLGGGGTNIAHLVAGS